MLHCLEMGADSNSLHNYVPKIKNERRVIMTERRRARQEAATQEYHEAHCPICAREDCDDLNELYTDWDRSDQEILDEYGLRLAEWKRHKKVLSLDVKRWENTEAIYEKMIVLGQNGLQPGDVKAADLLAAAARLDKVRGREKINVNVNGPPTIQINSFPAPGGILGAQAFLPASQTTVPGKLLEIGPPSVEISEALRPPPSGESSPASFENSPASSVSAGALEGFGDEPLLTVHDDGMVGKKKEEAR